MDGFIDKFAQRKNAQEMIRANAMAEAEERERMASQLSEYEMAMQEIRRCNLQTLENAEKVKELLMAAMNKIDEVQKKEEGSDRKAEELLQEMRNLSEELKSRLAELQKEQEDQAARLLEEQKSRLAELRRRRMSCPSSRMPGFRS